MKSFESTSSNFKSYSELASSGTIKEGWVPDFLPRSAFEIGETHNIDTNIFEVTFQFIPGDTELAESRCKSETNVKNGYGYFTNAQNDV